MNYQVYKAVNAVYDEKSDSVSPAAPEGHEYLRIKPKAKGSEVSWWIVPIVAQQLPMEVEAGYEKTVSMLYSLYDRQRKLWIAEYEAGNLDAKEWLTNLFAATERFFVDGRTLGVKQDDVEQWINDVLQPYMTARIAKNAGFSEAQKVSLVAALTKKFLIASTRNNEVKDKKAILTVPKEQLVDLQKRLATYAEDLEACEELSALQSKIKKHIEETVKEMEVTNSDF